LVTVGVIYDHPRWEEKAITSALKDLGVDVELIHVESTPLVLGEACCSIDVAVQRSLSLSAAVESSYVVESWGVEVLNSGWVIQASGDKVATLSLLSRAGVPVPRSVVLVSRKGLGKVLPPGPPWVVKPVSGSWGRMVARARDMEELEQLLEYKEYSRLPASRVHLVQEYVRKPGRDVRVFTLGGEVLTAIYRVSNHWITNTSRGASAVPADVDGELEEIALKASEALGGGFLGIDVMEDPATGLIVNEVNAVPEFRNTVRVTGKRIHMDVARHLLRIAKR